MNNFNSNAANANEKAKINAILAEYQDKQANILITGATGAGKSSTINAMFDMEIAAVGVGVNAETMDVARFELGNLTIWDSPGLGEDTVQNERHINNIANLLREEDENGDFLIDVVLVVLDGRSKDLGTSYGLINNVVIPNLRDNERLLVGINQADMMLAGRHWDSQAVQPLPPLQQRIAEKVESVRRHIYEATGVEVEPVAYSAGYKEDGQPQEPPYNLATLLRYMVEKIPPAKRAAVISQSHKGNFSLEDIRDLAGMVVLVVGGVFVAVLDGVETIFHNLSDLFE
ncbi:MAG: 50S ribosome-binding GTPase [Defluviitaleaceae bacterium]|nr:50S ribosome-binding GTPase [Defluviitaleaceae bacterium]